MKKLRYAICLLATMLGLSACSSPIELEAPDPAMAGQKTPAVTDATQLTAAPESESTGSETEETNTCEEETTVGPSLETTSDDPGEEETTAETETDGDSLGDKYLSMSEYDEFDWKTMVSSKEYPLPLSREWRSVPTPELVNLVFDEAAYLMYTDLQYRDTKPEAWRLATARDDYGRVFSVPLGDYYESWRWYNGFRELETREDAIPCLLEAYRHAHTNDLFGEYQMNGNEYLLMQCLEVVLSQDVYLDRMTAEEKATLYELIEGFHGADRSTISTEGAPVADQSYRFYPYYPVSDE